MIMLYQAKTTSEYLKPIDDDWRKEKLMLIRKMIQKNEPKLKEGIRYKMLSCEYDGKIVFCLNA